MLGVAAWCQAQVCRAMTCGYLSLDLRRPSLTRKPRSAAAVPSAISSWLLPVLASPIRHKGWRSRRSLSVGFAFMAEWAVGRAVGRGRPPAGAIGDLLNTDATRPDLDPSARGDAVVRGETSNQTDQESRSTGHRAGRSVMAITTKRKGDKA
jgi:hypothetical protein